MIKNKQVGVAFVTDKEIQKFNKRYLHKNTPTDVLAFSFTSECMSDYLGDIVISHETAQKQAALFKSSLDNELVLLLVHGILHLAGYTDYNEKEKQRMFIKQAIILKTSHEKKT